MQANGTPGMHKVDTPKLIKFQTHRETNEDHANQFAAGPGKRASYFMINELKKNSLPIKTS